jgi:hypothetical protein
MASGQFVLCRTGCKHLAATLSELAGSKATLGCHRDSHPISNSHNAQISCAIEVMATHKWPPLRFGVWTGSRFINCSHFGGSTMARSLTFRCSNTGYIVQGLSENLHTEPGMYEAVECAARNGNHLIDLESGEVVPPSDKRSM